jgi:hypothetical protein
MLILIMNLKKYLTLLLLSLAFTVSYAQMTVNGNVLYGNEWINYSQSYCKIKVANDGIHRVTGAALNAAGVPIATIPADQYKLYHLGQEVPLYLNTNNLLTANDFIEFYGKKNRSELDEFLFNSPNDLGNPKYSLFNDTAAYFLTWSSGAGKRIATQLNDLTNLPAKLDYFMHSQDTIFTTKHYKNYAELAENDLLFLSQYGYTEGFTSSFAKTRSITIPTVDVYKNGPSSRLDVLALWHNLLNVGHPKVSTPSFHKTKVEFNGQEVVKDSSFAALTFGKKNLIYNDIVSSQLAAQNTVNISSYGNTWDEHRVAYITLTYPRLFSFGAAKSFHFALDASANKRYIVIENLSNGAIPILYNIKAATRIEGKVNGTTAEFAIPASAAAEQFVFYHDAQSINPTIQAAAKFVEYSKDKFNYLIVSHKRLMSDKNGTNWVQEFANYRSSNEGGAYKAGAIDIEQLYDQYAYGIDRHAIALRNFTNKAATEWNAKHLFLVGRGIDYSDLSIRRPDYITSEAFFVPTYGHPAADNLISGKNGSIKFALATGRIPATKPQDVQAYLNKVKDYEFTRRNAAQSVEERAWMKRIANLIGGDIKVQDFAKNGLAQFSDILQNNAFGAEVLNFEKTSDDIVAIASEKLTRAVNSGVTLLNFFGHSSTGNIDYAIDLPQTMQNKGKTFFFLAYGCYSGQAHGVAPSYGTAYVMQPETGAIAYLGPGQFGTIQALYSFGNQFSKVAGTTHYDKTVGEMIQETVVRLEGNFPSYYLIHHMTYQGDPALRMNYSNEPDYVINPSTVKVDPSIVTVAQDNFDLNLDIANIGRNSDDRVVLQIERLLPNGKRKIEIIDTTTVNIRNSINKKYVIPVGSLKEAVGENHFFVTLDPQNKIKEGPLPQGEVNNDLTINGQKGLSIFIFGSDVSLLYPTRYAIINKNEPTFKVSTSNPFAAKQKYYFELDTTMNFNSPLKVATQIEQKGGLIEWKPTIQLADSTVYYWRVAPDSTAGKGQGLVWRTSSFIYLAKGELGWNQSHYFQMNDNFGKFLELTPTNRRFKYADAQGSIRLNNMAYLPTGNIYPGASLEANFAPSWTSGYWPGYNLSKSASGVMIWVNDGVTLEPKYQNIPPGLFGSDFKVTWTDYNFPFNTNTALDRANLMDFLETKVDKGDFVSIITIQHQEGPTSYFADQWAADSITLGKNIFQILEKQGAKKIRQTAIQSKPYIFCYRKDDPSFPITEVLADSVKQQIAASLIMSSTWKSGFLTSQEVGPAQSWSKIFWKNVEKEPTDESFLTVYGIQKNGDPDTLFQGIQSNELDISTVSAKTYPKLKLVWESSDTLNRTAPQLKYWRVTHAGIPEAVLAANKGFSLSADTLMQGEKLSVVFPTENVTDYNMDSLLVWYKVKSLNNNIEYSFLKRVKPLLANQSLTINLDFDTKRVNGPQELSIRINPNNDQIEYDTTNNFGIIGFYVKKDNKNPLVDVLFDGIRINNGDLVAPSPQIRIDIKDENQFLFMQDTSLFKVYLRYPNETNARRISFNDPILKFNPAAPNNGNRATIELSPTLDDGDYQLLIKARDVSDNSSKEYYLTDQTVTTPDAYNFKIAFKVITKSSISNILNYPNPFSTGTQFVYTLTGKELPFYFKIQIMTITGRVVRELTQAELGDMRIGTHKSDYVWDGTDQYGDKLAAGVYLYKVVAKKANGEDYEAFSNSSIDGFFKNGIGKLVILR